MKSRLVLVMAGCLVLSACSNLRMPTIWPFLKKQKPAPEVVNELNLVMADGTPVAFPQYWQRNTLVIDISGVLGEGSMAARLPENTTWPVRVALRVRPGSVGQIEVQGEERNVMPVTTEGSRLVDLELAPSVYTPTTAAVYISWGPVPVFAEAAPEPAAEPAFVSPTVVPEAAAPEAATPSASDIVSPAEAQPAQPSPPPGG